MSSRPFSAASKPSKPGGLPDGAHKGRGEPRRLLCCRPSRQMRERRTAYVLMAFGLLLGGIELFIVFQYV
jgi:hypothetical protein